LSTTTIPPLNTPTASTSLSKYRKKMRRTMLQHLCLCHWATSPSAQSEQQLQLFAKSNPIQLADLNTPISAIWKYGRNVHITSTQIKNLLRDAVLAIGRTSSTL
jgi:hypothetical protein